jgi:hypothetical protein
MKKFYFYSSPCRTYWISKAEEYESLFRYTLKFAQFPENIFGYNRRTVSINGR